jgi:hypothetical protein
MLRRPTFAKHIGATASILVGAFVALTGCTGSADHYAGRYNDHYADHTPDAMRYRFSAVCDDNAGTATIYVGLKMMHSMYEYDLEKYADQAINICTLKGKPLSVWTGISDETPRHDNITIKWSNKEIGRIFVNKVEMSKFEIRINKHNMPSVRRQVIK